MIADKTMLEYKILFEAVNDYDNRDGYVTVDCKTLDKLLYKYKSLVEFVAEAKELVNQL